VLGQRRLANLLTLQRSSFSFGSERFWGILTPLCIIAPCLSSAGGAAAVAIGMTIFGLVFVIVVPILNP